MVFQKQLIALLMVSGFGCATTSATKVVANNSTASNKNQPTKTSTVPQRVLLRNPFYQGSPMVWGDAEWSQQVFEVLCLFTKRDKTGNSLVRILRADGGGFIIYIPNECRKRAPDIHIGDEGEYYLWAYSMLIDQSGIVDGEATIDEYRQFFGRVIVALAMVDKNIPDGLYTAGELQHYRTMYLDFLAQVKYHLTID